MPVRLLVCLAGAVLAAGPIPAEPLYRGEGLGQYVRALRDPDAGRRHAAAEALGAMRRPDPAALRGLADALRDKEGKVRRAAAAALGALGADAVPFLAGALADAEAAVRVEAAGALRQMVPRPRSATAALLKALKDADGRVVGSAALALGRIGPADRRVVPALTDTLRAADPAARLAAVRALGRIGPAAREAVPGLAALLKERQENKAAPSAVAAAEALGRIGPAARAVAPALAEATGQDDPHLRLRAAWALLAVGESPRAVVPALGALLEGQEESLQAEAAELLGWVGPEAEAAVPGLVRLMASDQLAAARRALQALIRIGDRAAPELIRALHGADSTRPTRIAAVLKQYGSHSVALLAAALSDPRADVRAGAAQALGEFGRAARVAASRLEEALGDGEPRVRLAAAAALLAIDHSPHPALARVLARTIRAKDPEVRAKALELLVQSELPADWAVPAVIQAFLAGEESAALPALALSSRIGRRIRLAAPALGPALRDKNPEVRARAIEFLKMTEPAAEDVPVLAAALTDPAVEVRCSAVEALGAVGPAVGETLPLLRRALGDSETQVRESSIRALAAMGAAAGPAVSDLVYAFRDRVEREEEHRLAADALRKIGAPAVAPLKDFLKSGSPALRAAAADVLIAIATESDPPLLAHLLNEEEPEVRRAAAEALGKGPTSLAATLHPAVIRAALRDRDLDVRKYAVSALAAAGPAAAPVLRDALKDANAEVRVLAASALVQRGPHVDVAFPVLVREIRDGPDPVSELAQNGLKATCPKVRAVVPILRRALTSPVDGVREAAAVALGC